MFMKTRFARFFYAYAVLTLVAAGLCRAGGEQLDGGTQAQGHPSADGPTTIDVSRYPTGIQKNYRIFSQKCSQCHNLSRPINSDYVLPDEWSHCIRRMKRRSGSNIGSSEEGKLYDFLVFDSSVRKRDKLDEKLHVLPPDAQRQAEDKIKEVAAKYP